MSDLLLLDPETQSSDAGWPEGTGERAGSRVRRSAPK